MAGKAITVAQQKGGSGKTTLLAHLAVAFAGRGRRVALLDADPQGSLTLWLSQRESRLGANERLSGEATRASGAALERQIRTLSTGADLVLIDSPPRTDDTPLAAIRASDLVLVPVQPSPMDLWATRPTLQLAATAGKPMLLVLNRMPPRGRLAGEMAALLQGFGVPVARTSLGNRAAYAAALAEGRAVSELEPRGKAAAETAALADEVEAWLSGRRR
jgi:chromosome partitioning protein